MCILWDTSCMSSDCHPSKRLPGKSIILAAEAMVTTLALDYYRHMGPVLAWCNRLFRMFCLQAIEGGDTETPFIYHVMTLIWSLSDKSTHVGFCWMPSHCGIEGSDRDDQLVQHTLTHDVDPLTNVHCADLKPVLVSNHIHELVHTKCDRYLYLLKPTLEPPEKLQHLTRSEEVVITRLGAGHTGTNKSNVLSREPRPLATIVVKRWAFWLI